MRFTRKAASKQADMQADTQASRQTSKQIDKTRESDKIEREQVKMRQGLERDISIGVVVLRNTMGILEVVCDSNLGQLVLS